MSLALTTSRITPIFRKSNTNSRNCSWPGSENRKNSSAHANKYFCNLQRDKNREKKNKLYENEKSTGENKPTEIISGQNPFQKPKRNSRAVHIFFSKSLFFLPLLAPTAYGHAY